MCDNIQHMNALCMLICIHMKTLCMIQTTEDLILTHEIVVDTLVVYVYVCTMYCVLFMHIYTMCCILHDLSLNPNMPLNKPNRVSLGNGVKGMTQLRHC